MTDPVRDELLKQVGNEAASLADRRWSGDPEGEALHAALEAKMILAQLLQVGSTNSAGFWPLARRRLLRAAAFTLRAVEEADRVTGRAAGVSLPPEPGVMKAPQHA